MRQNIPNSENYMFVLFVKSAARLKKKLSARLVDASINQRAGSYFCQMITLAIQNALQLSRVHPTVRPSLEEIIFRADTFFKVVFMIELLNSIMNTTLLYFTWTKYVPTYIFRYLFIKINTITNVLSLFTSGTQRDLNIRSIFAGNPHLLLYCWLVCFWLTNVIRSISVSMCVYL